MRTIMVGLSIGMTAIWLDWRMKRRTLEIGKLVMHEGQVLNDGQLSQSEALNYLIWVNR